jgi:uncharacterized membrane protein
VERRFEASREYMRGALWVLPGLSVVIALVLGSVLSRVTVPAHSPLHRLVFQGTSDDARTLLIGIAGTMITVIALMLGLTVVALQMSSTQYSPRLLRNFLRDRPNQLVLSAFVATFAYSTAGLYTVGISGGNRTEDFPRLAVSGAIVLLFLSLFALVFEVHHVAHSMQVDEIMRKVENGTQQVIRDVAASPCDGAPPTVPESATPVRATRSGYVQVIHPEVLVDAAGQHAVNLAIAYRVGDHVVSGTPLAWVWRDDTAAIDVPHLVAAAHHAVRLGFERTLEQDAAFGIRQLVDIASKALSPAVNDPYTAVQAIDHIAVIMASIARREHGTAVQATAAGTTVTIPSYSFEDYLDLSCAQIRRFGSREPTVARELIGLLSSTAHTTQEPGRHAAIRRQLDLLVDDAARDVAQPADLDAVRDDADAVRGWLAPTGPAT